MPVHLGSMPASVAAVLETYGESMEPGMQYAVNDPYHGGTHLNDLTLVRPVHHDGRLIGWVANRAHHADVGGEAPGSMLQLLTLSRFTPMVAVRVWVSVPSMTVAPVRAVVCAVRGSDPPTTRSDTADSASVLAVRWRTRPSLGWLLVWRVRPKLRRENAWGSFAGP